jgi:hypothetical protein
MENIQNSTDISIEYLTKEYLEKIKNISPNNQGIFHALEILADLANLWELKLILLIAGKEPTTVENIAVDLQPNISKSTVYRKIADFLKINILNKDQNGNLKLAEKLNALSIAAKLRKTLNDIKGM